MANSYIYNFDNKKYDKINKRLKIYSKIIESITKTLIDFWIIIEINFIIFIIKLLFINMHKALYFINSNLSILVLKKYLILAFIFYSKIYTYNINYNI